MSEKEILRSIITTMAEEADIDKSFEEMRYLFRRYEEAEVREKCKAGDLNV